VSRTNSSKARLPRGVLLLPRPRGGRAYRAAIRRGKAGEVHLGLYETPWLAAFAYEVAARLVGRPAGPAAEPPQAEQPSSEAVRAITARVRRRLGLDPAAPKGPEVEPEADELATLFEVTIVGFWRGQAADDSWDRPGAGIDAAAGQLVEAARLLFWRRGPGHPSPLEAMARLLGRRLDAAFRRADIAREVLDDDGDDERRVARWLVLPDAPPGGRGRGFREEVRHLYAEAFDGDPDVESGPRPSWADVLGLAPPFTLDRVRSAYRARSRTAHPDAGGSDEAFVRLQAAYDEARAHCASRTG